MSPFSAMGRLARALFIGPYRAGPTWARNMLMKGLSAYGLASATGDDGRKYWVLELGN